jgi:membrane protein DedA with SNARE-associated domain
MMAIASACIPLPSEIIMSFSGFLVYKGVFTLHFVVLSGVLGEAVGSSVAYYAGANGGRPLVERYGKYILVRMKDVDRADFLFGKYGEPIVFFSRLVPVVRAFISFPAGVSRMNYGRFILYSLIGSITWCYFLGYLGMKLGERWETIRSSFHGADYVIVGLILVGFGVWLYHHTRRED